MKVERLELLPFLLEKYKDKVSIDIQSGTLEGLKVYENHKGYKTVNFWHKNHSRYYRIHELVAYLGGLELLNNTINHINGDKKDNRLENLEAVSALENHRLAKDQKLFKVGIDNHISKLTEEDVLFIRKTYKGVPGEQRILAEKYGVDQSTISHVVTNKTWKHLLENKEAI